MLFTSFSVATMVVHRVFLIVTLLQCISRISGTGWTNDRGALVDPLGRERYFHGINVIYKSAPYHPITSQPSDGKLYDLTFTATDAKFLRSLGLNVIRLGVMWGGTDPIPLPTPPPFLCDLAHACTVLRFEQALSRSKASTMRPTLRR